MQERHPSASTEKLTTNPTGTDKKPFVIKIFGAEKTPERIDQDRPEREEKAANERSFVVWTSVLGGATIVLAIIAGIQVVMFWMQLKLMRTAISDGTLVAKTAREEFLSTHRPKITVRRVALEEDRRTAEISIRYEIVNIGTRPAHILGGIAQIMLWQHPKDSPLPPFTDPLDTALYNVRGTIIEPGARHSEIVKASEAVESAFQFGRASDCSNLYFLGFIKYRDDRDTIRETSFCRRFEKTGFSKVDPPDYEYED
ncbi:MAG: hypothetical protein AABZ17_05785 [Nitrospirota bacterium]